MKWDVSKPSFVLAWERRAVTAQPFAARPSAFAWINLDFMVAAAI